MRPVLLTIDDDTDVLKSIERDLRSRYSETYRILSAASGQAALDLLTRLEQRNEPVALFLVDHRMPQMNGIEFLTEAMRRSPDTKRVLLTAYADTEAAIRAINVVRLHHYLLKPWHPPEQNLYPVIDELLEEWQANYHPAFDGIRVLGTRWSSKSYELREFLARNHVPYQWLDIENAGKDSEVKKLAASAGGEELHLPVVFFPDGTQLSQPANTQVAERVGLHTHSDADFFDLIVIGGGPAGLAAAVYGASEGLRSVIVERDAPGGQAGLSSLIENYLGFPSGLSGGELARRAVAQARRFGAEILSPQEVTSVRVDGPYRMVTLANGDELSCHALLVATGVQWRKLDIPGIERLQGAGVYYGAGSTEALACKGEDVYIIGGANSAGQAAMNFARYARQVTMLVRGPSLAATMSKYLIDDIERTPNISVQSGTRVTEVHGEKRLDGITIQNSISNSETRLDATGLFVFIGAEPKTTWLDGIIERDDRGFVLTGSDLLREGKRPKTWTLERDPGLLETSVPGIFAVGDVRHGSVKRVASGVGEGSIAIQFVHQYLAQVGA